jgi:hypothetical protein
MFITLKFLLCNDGFVCWRALLLTLSMRISPDERYVSKVGCSCTRGQVMQMSEIVQLQTHRDSEGIYMLMRRFIC